MKYCIILLVILSFSFHSVAQPLNYKVNPKAKRLDDSAIKLFTTCGESADCYKKINVLLDEAVKIDPKWYEGWANLISYLGRTDQYDKCLTASIKLLQLYPDAPEAVFNCGIIQYKTKHPADALISFGHLLKIYDNLLLKKPKIPNYNAVLTQKGITLILMDKDFEGKSILRKLYTDETEPYQKSFIAFYINKTKAEIIEDRIPGK